MTRYLGADHYSDSPKVKLTLKPVPKFLGMILIVGAVAWFGATTFLPHKKIVRGAAKIPAHMALQLAYEDKLSAMQTALDQLNNKLVNRAQDFATRVAKLRAQQAQLTQRHHKLETLLQKTLGKSDLALSALPFSPKVSHDSRTITPNAPQLMTQQMADLHAQQGRLGVSLADHTQNRAKVLSKILGKLKAKISRKSKKPASVSTVGIGGPFVRLGPVATLDQALDKIEHNTRIINNLTQSITDMPVAHPVSQTAGISSRFGPRKDPVRKTRALHSGVDIKGKHGTPVLATANGIVIKAGRYKAYGRMVELKHKGGISTRYAHLSRIGVNVGDRVKAHDLIGRIGSTGRSTGPHLHYETRLRGRAVNPLRFLQAGKYVYEVKDQGSTPLQRD